MLGQPISMTLPPVLGVRVTGRLGPACTTTDIVLHVVSALRARGVVDHFVEFFGEACASLSAADRATIANMSPEFGATIGYFPPDEATIKYLISTGRSEKEVEKIKAYLVQQGMFRTYEVSEPEVRYTGELHLTQATMPLAHAYFQSHLHSLHASDKIVYADILDIDLSKIEPCVAGPKRPQDTVLLRNLKTEFLVSSWSVHGEA